MSQKVTVRNVSNVIVHVAGISVAPNRTTTISVDAWTRWIAACGSNMDASESHLAIISHDAGQGDAGQGDYQPPAPPPADTRIELIKDAIADLPTEVEKNWTKKGLPDLTAIEIRVGFDITAAERDEAWAEIQAELNPESPDDVGDNT